MLSPTLHLHTYYRSSCSARIHTAAHLKEIPLTYTYIHLPQNQQFSTSYTSINPSATVPTLTVTEADGTIIIIRQSIAILEFFEEYFPEKLPMMPPISDVVGRARVRELVNIVACDIQPPTNLRILNRVKGIGGDEVAWAKSIIEAGLKAYDKVAGKYAGIYSVGDEITLADVVLAPAVERALRFGVDVRGLRTVWGVYGRVRGVEAFWRGSWRFQEDTPEDFRVEE